MRTDDAIKFFKGVANLARVVKVTRAAIYKWGERPPLDRQCQIEVMTGGALKADVDREEILARVGKVEGEAA